VFWLIGTPLLWASLVFDIYLPLMASEPASSRALRLASVTSLYSSDLVLVLSAIQGLRMTWSRFPWNAALLLILTLIVPFAETFSTPRATADFFGHLYTSISISPSWGLAAWVADLVARRFVRTSHISRAELPDSKQVTQSREMNAQLHVPDPSPPVEGQGTSKEEFGQAERVVQLYRRLVLLVGVQFVLVVIFLRIPAAARRRRRHSRCVCMASGDLVSAHKQRRAAFTYSYGYRLLYPICERLGVAVGEPERSGMVQTPWH